MKKIRKAIKKQLSYVREMSEVMLDNSKRKEVESEREILGKMMVALQKRKYSGAMSGCLWLYWF